MKMKKNRKQILMSLLAAAVLFAAAVPAIPVRAASGAVYTCSITPCYRHPVTGVIEDSGGEASYATGQGMVEGCVYQTGILEVTSDGNYYLTIRMSLMDYTSNHTFWVQNVGDSGWASPAIGATGSGSDSNGTTTDICIQVPSENCVVRGAMYVEPMGRDVVFYLYPSNYSEGNNTNMNVTIVSSGGDAGSAQASGGSSASGTAASGGSGLAGAGSLSAGAAGLEQETTEDGGASELQSSITSPASSDTTQDTGDSSLNGAQGLSLSTAEDRTEAADEVSASAGSVGQQIVVRVVSVTVPGVILMAVAAGIVYFFRKNWYRWGGGEDDYDE